MDEPDRQRHRRHERAGEITLRTRHDDEWAVVEIEDNGPGIPAAIQANIFDPFFTTKPPGPGTGMGLNITHHIIVNQHKGRIAVYSEPGKTRFEVHFPLHQRNANNRQTPSDK